MVVRMWYCDIGRRGNVPNWAVREKLLEKFLVGGKPVPGRVFDVSVAAIACQIIRTINGKRTTGAITSITSFVLAIVSTACRPGDRKSLP